MAPFSCHDPWKRYGAGETLQALGVCREASAAASADPLRKGSNEIDRGGSGQGSYAYMEWSDPPRRLGKRRGDHAEFRKTSQERAVY